MDPHSAFNDFCQALARSEAPGANLPESVAKSLPDLRRVAEHMSRYFSENTKSDRKQGKLHAALDIMEAVQNRDPPSHDLIQTMNMLCITLAKGRFHVSSSAPIHGVPSAGSDEKAFPFYIQSLSRDISDLRELTKKNSGEFSKKFDEIQYLLKEIEAAGRALIRIEHVFTMSGNKLFSDNKLVLEPFFGPGFVGDDLFRKFYSALAHIAKIVWGSPAPRVIRDLVDKIIREAREFGRHLSRHFTNIARHIEILEKNEPKLDPNIGSAGERESDRDLNTEELSDLASDDRLERRLMATEFARDHDDGQRINELSGADVIVVGLPEASKTTLCLLLANYGIKAANIPIAPNIPFPPEIDNEVEKPIVGLRISSDELLERRVGANKYGPVRSPGRFDLRTIQEETEYALRVFRDHRWPIINTKDRTLEQLAELVMKEISFSTK